MTKALSLLPALLVSSSLTAQTTVPIAPGQVWQTVINAAPAGSVFLIKSGVHRMQSVTARNGDTFLGETMNGRPVSIASGARQLTTWTRSGPVWFVTGQIQEGRLGTDPDACLSTHPRCNYPEELFIDNVVRKHVAALTDVTAGTWFFDYPNDRIYIGEDPTGHTVETSVTPTLFLSGPATNVTIDGLIVEKYASPTGEAAVNLGASFLGGTGWTLRNSIVRWNHGGGIGLDAESKAIHNEVTANCGFGLVGAGWNILADGNTVTVNNIVPGTQTPCGFNPYWGAGGSKFVYTTDLIVRNNTTSGNYGPGFWTDINNIGTVYENNLVEDNYRSGLFHEISYQARIVGNTLRRNGRLKDFPGWTTSACIEVAESSDVEVANNLCEDNSQGITGLAGTRTGGAVATHGPWGLVNLNVHDNRILLSSPPAAGWGMSGIIDTAGTTAFNGSNRFRNNTYVNATSFLWMNTGVTLALWNGFGQDVIEFLMPSGLRVLR